MPKVVDPAVLERRAKRELRRERQRQENVGRAEKMHLARLEAATQGIGKARVPVFKPTGHFVGCSGWFYWHWRGIFYPPEVATSKWFEFYADHFRTVELNAPFYSWPTVATVKSWLRQAGRRRFIYTVKVNELITHTKRFRKVEALVKDFGFIADLLGARIGCFLFQLPPSFHYTPARLKSIVSQLDDSRRNVVEFRHRSWWNEKVFDAFRKNGTIFCSCSGPRLPDELIKTAEDIYIRFHGTKRWYRHNYSKDELVEWARRVRESGAKRVWAYFNNDRDGYAIDNARALLRLLKK